MLTKRHRIIILFAVIIGWSIPFAFNLLYASLPDPTYFQQNFSSRYSYNDGQSTNFIDFITTSIESDYTELLVKTSSKQYSFNFSKDGYYINYTGVKTNLQSLFWTYIDVGNDFTNQVGKKFDIIDLIGIIAEPNQTYELEISDKDVYWSEEPGVHGAQASYFMKIYNKTGVMFAEGEMDYTCGMLFYLRIGGINYRYLKLINTDYVISKNRFIGIIGLLISLVAIPFILYLYSRKKESNQTLLYITFLTIFGLASVFLDLYSDIWLYALFGLGGNLLIHCILILVGLLFSIYQKIEFKWVIPSLLEIMFLLAMVLLVGESYVGHLTTFMGAVISFLFLLWLTGYEHQRRSESLKGRISHHIV